ncbi:hypothetical protein L6452_11372 [Arctium lappa]|uniref:Uncharacterized protein n=1 Tax=Arctium lappa TaxID=4217 RepID=A0ACB9DPE5_ARCLA|nr:hypothetical protein L6452_11372 [Arctium lappa]
MPVDDRRTSALLILKTFTGLTPGKAFRISRADVLLLSTDMCSDSTLLSSHKSIRKKSIEMSKPVSLDEFEELCPLKGENKVVIYTTTLRGVRKTFEASNAVRTVMEGYRVFVCERDISMDQGFREESRELMKGKDNSELVPPRVFVKGRYVGGAEEVLKTMEEGRLGRLLEDLPKSKAGFVCDGCGGVRFLSCFTCDGSCKITRVKTIPTTPTIATARRKRLQWTAQAKHKPEQLYEFQVQIHSSSRGI